MWESLAPQAQRGVALAEPPAVTATLRVGGLSAQLAVGVRCGNRGPDRQGREPGGSGCQGVGVVRVRRRARRTGHAQRAPEHHDHQLPPLLRPPWIPAGPASRQGRTTEQERGAMSRKLIRCMRCGKRCRSDAAFETWIALWGAGQVIGSLCPTCQTPRKRRSSTARSDRRNRNLPGHTGRERPAVIHPEPDEVLP